MSDEHAVRPCVRKVEEGTRFHARTDGIVAVLVLSAAAACALYFRLPLVFDPDASNFNPVAFVPVILSLFALKYVIAAFRGSMLGRRFGKTVMEMEGETVAPGATLRGVVRVPVDLAPLGDYEVRLRCVQQTRPTSTSTNLKDYIRGEQTLRVNAQTVNPREGVPFTFMIPTDAMTTANSDLMTEGSVRWILEVKAPLKGLDFYAIFGVDVRPLRQLDADRALGRAT
jgi:hypothetical protein